MPHEITLETICGIVTKEIESEGGGNYARYGASKHVFKQILIAGYEEDNESKRSNKAKAIVNESEIW